MNNREFPPLPNAKFGVVYADPPWNYKSGQMFMGAKVTSLAEAHYPTATLSELKKLNVSSIADDVGCLLFMWATSPHLDQAIELGKAWGFDWSTVAFVWDKVRTNPGYWTNSQCELVLAFKRGKFPKDRGSRTEKQLLVQRRGAHSAKPDEVRRRIEEMFPRQAKIELFAREKVRGWNVWGLETETRIYKDPREVIRKVNAAKRAARRVK